MDAVQCPICLDPLVENKAVSDPCGHIYHHECILTWIQKSSSKCPKCRLEITNLKKENADNTPITPKEFDKLHHMIIEEDEDEEEVYEGSSHVHLHSQKCCICDHQIIAAKFMICPTCSSLFHSNCSSFDRCPLCESEMDESCVHSFKKRRKRVFDDDLSRYSVIVDQLNRQEQQSNCLADKKTVEDEAWNALNLVTVANKGVSDDSGVKQEHSTEIKRKFKRPGISKRKEMGKTDAAVAEEINKCTNMETVIRETDSREIDVTDTGAIHESSSCIDSTNPAKNDNSSNLGKVVVPLTEDVLCKYDKSYRVRPRIKELNFLQKLVVQCIFIKPELDKIKHEISIDSYTKLNKVTSHKLYSYWITNSNALKSLNLVVRLIHENNFKISNRKQFNLFYSEFQSDPIIVHFRNCDWTTVSENEVFKMIDSEIRKVVRMN